MLSVFVHRRPLLRALFAMMLFAGLLSMATATHAGLTSSHPVAAAVDTATGDIDTAELDDSACTQDNAEQDALDIPEALTLPRVDLAGSRPVTAHAVPHRRHCVRHAAGLITGIVGGLTVGFNSASPLQVSSLQRV